MKNMLMKYFSLFLMFLVVSYSQVILGQTTCTDLVNNIIKSSVGKKIPVKTLHPLSNFNLMIKDATALEVFKISKQNFKDKLNINILDRDLNQLLKDLTDQDFIKELSIKESEYQELLIQLKDLRKQAAILRTIFVVFSDEHISPEAFEKFTKNLGKLNDAIEFRAFDLIKDNAQNTRKSFDLIAINREIKNFKTAKPKSIKKTLKNIREYILDLIKKEDMTVEEFHETRKELKHFMASIQMMKVIDSSTEMESTFKFLSEINDTLGAQRDELLQEELSNPNNQKKSEIENIPENIKQAIRDFFNRLEIIIN